MIAQLFYTARLSSTFGNNKKDMRSRFIILVVAIPFWGCSEQHNNIESTMTREQPDNTLVTFRDDAEVVLSIASASYNFNVEPHGCEFTLSCVTKDTAEYNPKLEVTIVLPEPPNIVAGDKWANQPAYIDRDPLFNLTNYYEWVHEGFEDFTLEVLKVSDDVITCRLTGTITLNPGPNKEFRVSVLADFKRDKSIERSVW
ncbi:hypothetical protein NT6N_24050 [Oceaniferula spumae]|uniref:Lipoprotein n=1 Tax=Oceaniferula spumae TaxID=2979115 RepID=A0AAT9FN00_9BACT